VSSVRILFFPAKIIRQPEPRDVHSFLKLQFNPTFNIPIPTTHPINMSIPSQSAALCCRRVARPSYHCLRSSPAYLSHRRATGRRWQATAAAATPVSSNPKITSIVDQISQLTLLETADLVSTLKVKLHLPDPPQPSIAPPSLLPQTSHTNTLHQTRLNIPDIPMGFAAGAGPAAAAAPPPVEEEEAPAAAPAKTLFNLTLKSFDAGAKPKIIKEVKSMLGLSLVDSKKFVESAPKLMKEGVPKDEAEKIVETLKALGGVVAME
jgi:large subunit ribosomal protein L7/L12